MKFFKKIFGYIGHFLVAVFLAVGTQVGGLIYLFSIFIGKIIVVKYPGRFKKRHLFGFFAVLYLTTSLFVLPYIAGIFGRVPLPYFKDKGLKPNAAWIWLMNRHYVKPALREATFTAAAALQAKYPDAVVVYLDANFPFWDGFPLLPHLSHNDGKKLDLAFQYLSNRTKPKQYVPGKTPSILGYGVCDEPREGELDYPSICAKKGEWQYNLLQKIQTDNKRYSVDAEKTTDLILHFSNQNRIKKIFIEPHLKQRWGLGLLGKIRYAGCHAVRHDDHIHVQL